MNASLKDRAETRLEFWALLRACWLPPNKHQITSCLWASDFSTASWGEGGIQHRVAVATTSRCMEAGPTKMYVHLKPCLDKGLCSQAAVKLF